MQLAQLTDIKQSKLGSGRRDRLETSFLRQVGHSLLPDLKAVIMQSLQKRCKHSLVVIVFFSMSRQIGHLETAELFVYAEHHYRF